MSFREEYLRDASLAIAELRVGTPGAAVALAATPLEINRTTDVSGRLVSAGATLAVTEALHDGKTILLDTLAGSVCTLPPATGSGAKFRFKVGVLATSVSHKVQVTTTDIMQGIVNIIDTDTAGTTTGFATAADSDTITLNRTTSGSVTRGEWLELEDIAAGVWSVCGQLSNTASGATPFTAAVS